MKIKFRSVGRPDDEIYQTVEMPAVPRVDDTIQFGAVDGLEYEVHHVVWMPSEPDYDVYVVLR